MRTRTCFIMLTLFFFNVSASAQTKTTTSPSDKLNNYISSLKNDDDLTAANWGFCLMDPATGAILAEYNKEKSLMPASGMKAITTLSALNILGADYKYTTTLEYDSTITSGILNGNLYIKGSGDPTLGSNRIKGNQRFDTLVNDWAVKLKNLGITIIKGNIIADANAFEDYSTPGSWNWDDIGQYYGAGPYGLNVYENAYTIYFSSTKTTSRVDSVFPAIEGLTVYNDTRVGAGSDAFIYGAPDSYYRYVVGGIPAGRKEYTVRGSMPDPPLFLATELKKALEKNGITR
ncbi:MAG: D-alanyl-D-alanine carboxypeptidase/D-alanyl-D-alanine-endopeptidase [Fimbriimonadaceae bacterium]|nr:D-alanyl-D-alanine carboxypeptidase/D-alanyl-D-alanine-endopeptidase [Chitinophagales bacterium]